MQKRCFRILLSRMAPKSSKKAQKETNTGEKKESSISILKSGDYSIKM